MITTPLRQRVILALIGTVVILVLLAGAIRLGSGAFESGYELTARFDRVLQGLTAGRSDVKIRGITVGRVTKIELHDDGKVDVKMFMQPEAKVADTTRAAIEPLSVFGPKFIRLDPGAHETSGPFLEAGAAIDKVERPVDFLDFVSHGGKLLEQVEAEEIFTIVHTLADGLDALGPELEQTVDAGEVISGRAARQSGNVRALLSNIARVSEALAGRGEKIVAGARDLSGVLQVIGSRPDQLGELLDSTARVSSVLGNILEANPEAVDRTIVGLSNLVDVIADDIPGAVALIDALDNFFNLLGRSVQIDISGRPDVTIAAIQTWASTNVCNIIAGLVCEVGAARQSTAAKTIAEASAGRTPAPLLAPVVELLLPLGIDPKATLEELLRQ